MDDTSRDDHGHRTRPSPSEHGDNRFQHHAATLKLSDALSVVSQQVSSDILNDPDKCETTSLTRCWPQGPQEPQPLKDITNWTFLSVFWNSITLFLPFTFLAMGLGAIGLDGKPVSTLGENIIAASQYGTTVFPIMFASIMSRLARALALWKCERGTTLGHVEQLIGSQSLGATVERLFQLRIFDAFGICVTLLWLLSPLGSQMSLRLLDKTDVEYTSQSLVRYFNTCRDGILDKVTSAFSDGYQQSSVRSVLTLLISANMLSPRDVVKSPVDQWKNVKIPLLDKVVSPTESAANPWIPVEEWNKTWVSISGLMVADVPKTGISTFKVETSFLNVSCSDVVMVPANATDQDKAFKSAGFDLKLINTSAPNESPDERKSWRSIFLDTKTAVNGRYLENGSQSLIFGSVFGKIDNDRGMFALYDCEVENLKVEGNVTCNEQSCKLTHLRRSGDVGHPPLSMPPYTAIEYKNLLRFVPSALGDPRPGLPSPVDLYLQGSDDPLSQGLLDDQWSYSGLLGTAFAKRMTTLLNTVWQAGLCPFQTSAGSSVNFGTCNRPNATLDEVFPQGRSTATTRDRKSVV